MITSKEISDLKIKVLSKLQQHFNDVESEMVDEYDDGKLTEQEYAIRVNIIFDKMENLRALINQACGLAQELINE